MKALLRGAAAIVVAGLGLAQAAPAAVVVTEVMSNSGSGGTPDWFELTNTGPASQSLAGWKMDDSSATLANAVNIAGVGSLAVNERAVFILLEQEDIDDATLLATAISDFRTFWGSGLGTTQVGYFLDAGTGLSSNGDGVAIFNDAGAVVSQVSFGSSTSSVGVSFAYDTAGTSLGLSVAGQDGAFASADALGNVGSPGVVVPEPTTLAAVGLAGLACVARRRR